LSIDRFGGLTSTSLPQKEVRPIPNSAKAIIVGLCAHGLALVRALSDAGVGVIAVETNNRLPGCRTNKATVVELPDVNGGGLVDGLVELAETHRFDQPPVLFLTNDRMVRRVAKGWPVLQQHFRLSWGDSVEQVVRYLDKRHIENRCNAAGILYPKTMILEEIAQDIQSVRYPAILKPANPLGEFKAVIVEDESELLQTADRYSASLPFIVQDWVAGPDSSLLVCAMILDRGRVSARFDGRKLSSYPPGTGQTSIMECRHDDRVYEVARSFFSGLGIDGPVSIEVKKSPAGELFVIEPTVGRTDYFLDAMTRNGVNLPFFEFMLATGHSETSAAAEDRAVWFDTERDRTCFLRSLSSLFKNGRIRRPVFPYARWDDIRPFLTGLRKAVPDVSRSIIRRIVRRRSKSY
jgi:D-aspartate ligase